MLRRRPSYLLAIVLAVPGVLASVSCRKKAVASPLPPTPAPTTTVPAATTPAPTPVQTPPPVEEPATPKPQPTVRPPVRPPSTSVPPPVPPATVTNPPSSPPPLLGDVLTPDQQRQLNNAIDQSLNNTQSSLGTLASRQLTKEQQLNVAQIQSFVQQAQATRRSDLVAAESLAKRAEVLAGDLVRRVK